MIWIIQDKIFGEETDLLIGALKNNNISYMITDKPLVCDPSKVILRGSTDFIRMFENANNNKYFRLTLENYDCSRYYQYFGSRMLNSDFIILPWWKLKDSTQIFQSFPNTEKFFIRPEVGRKIFTGTTLTKKWWDKELDIIYSLPSSNIKDSDLVLVSSYKEIVSEYRVLMHKNNVIDYSRYSGEELFDEEFAISFQSSVIDFFPDMLYTMDIAATKEGFKLLELNSFVSAGLYDIDYNKVVNYIESLK